jgi:hypothetical protein
MLPDWWRSRRRKAAGSPGKVETNRRCLYRRCLSEVHFPDYLSGGRWHLRSPEPLSGWAHRPSAESSSLIASGYANSRLASAGSSVFRSTAAPSSHRKARQLLPSHETETPTTSRLELMAFASLLQSPGRTPRSFATPFSKGRRRLGHWERPLRQQSLRHPVSVGKSEVSAHRAVSLRGTLQLWDMLSC